ncbi:hypothetical protein LUX05_22755 [Streptomyces somaliensis]|nr:hypothetical protein [Streptomyces somaliensis]
MGRPGRPGREHRRPRPGRHPLKDGELPLDVTATALGAGGRTLAASRLAEREVLELWDVRTGKRLRSVPDFSGAELALRRDGAVAASETGSVDLRSGRIGQRALGWDDPVRLAFSPDGTRLAARRRSGPGHPLGR